jgi:hypothetical protein
MNQRTLYISKLKTVLLPAWLLADLAGDQSEVWPMGTTIKRKLEFGFLVSMHAGHVNAT